LRYLEVREGVDSHNALHFNRSVPALRKCNQEHHVTYVVKTEYGKEKRADVEGEGSFCRHVLN
jgi:hypothetical protein